MNKLKAYINWLLGKRTTPAQAAHAAMPDTSDYQTLTLGSAEGQDWKMLGEWTAPCDGYVTVHGQASGIPSGGASEVALFTDARLVSQIYAPRDGNGIDAFVPIKKGSVFSVYGAYYKPTGATIKRLVGGGVNP